MAVDSLDASRGAGNSSESRQISSGSSRTPLWVLISVSLGTMLPVFGCGFLILVLIAGLNLLSVGDAPARSTGFGDAVAIVRVEGVITASDQRDVRIGAVSGVIIDDLETAAGDPAVKALVLRVDSPGGAVTAAAQIYEAILRADKPVVVSMASLAASGGYYISAPADYIFARPDTLTGSIGVISTFINAEALLDDLGVEATVVASGPNKDFGSIFSELTPEQQQIWQAITDELYAEFLRVISDGRNMTLEEVQALADGRVFSGRQALANGLVDELGDLQAAIAKAAQLGGISGEPRIVEYQRVPSLQSLLTGFSASLRRDEADEIRQMIDDLTTPRLEYRYVGPR